MGASPPSHDSLPEEVTERRNASIRKVLVAMLKSWKTTIMFGIGVWFGWHERFWRDPVYRFTVPMLLFLTSLPVLDELGFSFIPHLRRLFTRRRTRD